MSFLIRIKDLIDLSEKDASCYFGQEFELKHRRMIMNAPNQFTKICMISSLTLLLPFGALSQNEPLKLRQAVKIEVAPKLENPRPLEKPTGTKFELKNIEKSKPTTDRNKSKPILRSGGTGVDGGGGNLRNGPPLTRRELEQYIDDPVPIGFNTPVQMVLKYIFNSTYSGHSGLLYGMESFPQNIDKPYSHRADWWRSISSSTHKKLFDREDGKTIYDVLKTAKIVLQDPACLDPYSGKPNDGSADGKTGIICLSWDRLSKKLFSNNFESYLIPLLAHEYSHLVGTNEQEAEALEDILKTQVGFEKIKKNVNELELSISDLTSQIPDAIRRLMDAIQSKKQTAICIRSFQLHNIASSAYGYIWSRRDFTLFNSLENSRVETLWWRLLNLTKYCESIQMNEILSGIEPDDLLSIDYAFGNHSNEISVLNLQNKVHEYYKAKDQAQGSLLPDQVKFLPMEGMIAKVANGDSQAMLDELDRIKDLLIWLKNETRVFEYPEFSTEKNK
ncbi:MAG: hypothetical protein ACK5V3_13740 [Bdellovibrionales bacterium]